ncbi:MAG: hypothetical protein U9Q33_13290 [Campylobacterota bacterium]|nr:hypothetical protein [Campylobacterota bacterium]
MRLEKYKDKLNKLYKKLQRFDPNKADNNYKELNKFFNTVYKSGVLDITHLPKELQDSFKLELFTTLSKVSGSTAFLAIQILAANNIISKHNYKKKEHYFNKKCGIAINHLRAPFTVVSALKCEGGYRLNGILTWASGYKIFDTLLIGFHYEGFEYEVLSAFETKKGFSIGDADETFTGYGLNTVNIELKEFFVKDEDIVSSNPIGNYTKQKSASKTVHFCLYALGVCAIEESVDKEFKKQSTKKLENIKDSLIKSGDIDELDSLRVELFCLVQDIVTTAMILIGGKSILSSQNLQRVYRELIMFNSNGLNDTLKSLFKKRFLKN